MMAEEEAFFYRGSIFWCCFVEHDRRAAGGASDDILAVAADGRSGDASARGEDHHVLALVLRALDERLDFVGEDLECAFRILVLAHVDELVFCGRERAEFERRSLHDGAVGLTREGFSSEQRISEEYPDAAMRCDELGDMSDVEEWASLELVAARIFFFDDDDAEVRSVDREEAASGDDDDRRFRARNRSLLAPDQIPYGVQVIRPEGRS